MFEGSMLLCHLKGKGKALRARRSLPIQRQAARLAGSPSRLWLNSSPKLRLVKPSGKATPWRRFEESKSWNLANHLKPPGAFPLARGGRNEQPND